MCCGDIHFIGLVLQSDVELEYTILSLIYNLMLAINIRLDTLSTPSVR